MQGLGKMLDLYVKTIEFVAFAAVHGMKYEPVSGGWLHCTGWRQLFLRICSKGRRLADFWTASKPPITERGLCGNSDFFRLQGT